MLTRLLVLLCCLLAGASFAQVPPPGQQNPPPAPAPPAEEATAVRVIVLQHLEIAALQPLLGMPLFTNNGVQGGMPFSPVADLVPKGIDSLLGMVQSNAILVRAKAPTLEAANAAIDQLAALLKMLDRPMKRIIIEVALVETTYGETRELGGSVEMTSGGVAMNSNNGGGQGNFGLRRINGQSRVALSSMIAENKAKVYSTAKVMVMQDGSGFISLQGMDLPLDTLAVRKASALPNGDIVMQIEPIYSLDGVICNTPVVRTRDGEAIFLGMLGGPAITKSTVSPPRPLKLALPRHLNLSANDPVILLYATPSVLPEELDDPFPVFKQLLPLF